MCAFTYMLEYVVYGFSHENLPHADWPWGLTSVLWPGQRSHGLCQRNFSRSLPQQMPEI